MDIPYEDSLLYTRWINGIQYLRDYNPEEDIKLIHTHSKLLAVVAFTSVDNCPDTVSAMILAMGAMLRLGYYLGQNGIGADAPTMTPEYLKRKLEPIITPNCNCNSCQAKLDLLKEYGVEYEMTPERQEMADMIEEQKQVDKMIEDALPPDDYNPSVN